MDTVKASAFPRAEEGETIGDIADWMNTVAKQESSRTGAFRRTLDGLLSG